MPKFKPTQQHLKPKPGQQNSVSGRPRCKIA